MFDNNVVEIPPVYRDYDIELRMDPSKKFKYFQLSLVMKKGSIVDSTDDPIFSRHALKTDFLMFYDNVFKDFAEVLSQSDRFTKRNIRPNNEEKEQKVIASTISRARQEIQEFMGLVLKTNVFNLNFLREIIVNCFVKSGDLFLRKLHLESGHVDRFIIAMMLFFLFRRCRFVECSYNCQNCSQWHLKKP